jgi:hypothetical protein
MRNMMSNYQIKDDFELICIVKKTSHQTSKKKKGKKENKIDLDSYE